MTVPCREEILTGRDHPVGGQHMRSPARLVLMVAASIAYIALPMAGAAQPVMSWEAESEGLVLTPEKEADIGHLSAERAKKALAELDAAASERHRFHALPDAARGAYELGRFDLAAALAAESLERAASYKGDWNYGNAIHMGHTVKGLLALRGGNEDLAIVELRAAGATPGSPQLDSFGPSMALARALLRAGKSEEVLRYLEQCQSFWKMGDTWLAIWDKKIRAGEVPNFLMNRW